jgi:hypothetical protein
MIRDLTKRVRPRPFWGIAQPAPIPNDSRTHTLCRTQVRHQVALRGPAVDTAEQLDDPRGRAAAAGDDGEPPRLPFEDAGGLPGCNRISHALGVGTLRSLAGIAPISGFMWRDTRRSSIATVDGRFGRLNRVVTSPVRAASRYASQSSATVIASRSARFSRCGSRPSAAARMISSARARA